MAIVSLVVLGAAIAGVAYLFFRYWSGVSQRFALRKYYDSVRGFGALAPVPEHPIFGHVASWIDRKLWENGFGLPMTTLMSWAEYALDKDRNPDGAKFLRIQMMGNYMPMSRHVLMVLDVDVIKDALVAAAEQKVKKGQSYRLAAPIIGDGILASTWGESWKHQRKLMEVAFRLENLKYSHKQVAKTATRLNGRWRRRNENAKLEGTSGFFDLRAECLRTTMDVICQVGFGRDFEEGVGREDLFELEKEFYQTPALKALLKKGKGVELDGEPLHKVFKEILRTMSDINQRVNPAAYFNETSGAYKQRLKLINRLVDMLIEERLAKVRRGDRSIDGTLLDAVANVDEYGELIMSKKLMADELKTLLFAGHDTTGNALTWALYRLAVHPECAAKMRHEVDNVLPEKTTFSDLERAPYLNAFVKEVLRVHPSAGYTREVSDPKGVTLGGVHLPYGTDFWFMPPLVHMQERYFERAKDFIPERWMEGSKLGMDQRAYIPFSLGPRNCVGTKLAQLELRCFVAEIVRRWDLEFDNSEGAPQAYLGMTIDPGRVLMRAKPRSDTGGKRWKETVELREG